MSKPSHSLLRLSGNRIGPLRCRIRGRRAEVRGDDGCESDWDPRLDMQQTNTSESTSLRSPLPHPVSSSPLSKTSSPGYARTVDEQGKVIEADAHAGLPNVKLARGRSPPTTERKKKKRRHAGQCTDANGRLVPWWEEWEQGEHRTTSVSFRDGCVRSYILCVVWARLSVRQYLCVFCGSRASGYR